MWDDFKPGEVTEDYDPEDPFVRCLSSYGMVPHVLPTSFERILREPEF
jgi:hypothetical protein